MTVNPMVFVFSNVLYTKIYNLELLRFESDTKQPKTNVGMCVLSMTEYQAMVVNII